MCGVWIRCRPATAAHLCPYQLAFMGRKIDVRRPFTRTTGDSNLAAQASIDFGRDHCLRKACYPEEGALRQPNQYSRSSSNTGCKDRKSERISSSDRYRGLCVAAQEADISNTICTHCALLQLLLFATGLKISPKRFPWPPHTEIPSGSTCSRTSREPRRDVLKAVTALHRCLQKLY